MPLNSTSNRCHVRDSLRSFQRYGGPPSIPLKSAVTTAQDDALPIVREGVL